MRILLVDDCEVSLDLMTNCLRKWDIDDVVIVRDGDCALKAFKEQQFDIVIADWVMPKLDGLALLKEIRRLDDAIPVIIVTAHANDENFLAAWSSGGSGFVAKPFVPLEFREAIVRCTAVI